SLTRRRWSAGSSPAMTDLTWRPPCCSLRPTLRRPTRKLVLPAVRDAHAAPGVTHLLVVNHGVVDLDLEPKDLRRERAGRRQHGIGGHDAVALRGDQRHAGVDEILLGVEHVERGALADAGFLAHAVERDLGGGDL